MWAIIEQLRKGSCRCQACHEDFLYFVADRFEALDRAWYDFSAWPSALEGVQCVLRERLCMSTETTEIPIQAIRYTHNRASDTFKHGLDRGRLVEHVADDLVSGRKPINDPSMRSAGLPSQDGSNVSAQVDPPAPSSPYPTAIHSENAVEAWWS